MDVMAVRLGDGLRFRLLNVLDDLNRAGFCSEDDLSFPSERGIRSLTRIIEWRGPSQGRPESTTAQISRQMLIWDKERGITIQPDQPRQNAHIKRIDRTVRHDWRDQYIIEPSKRLRTSPRNGSGLQQRPLEPGHRRHRLRPETENGRVSSQNTQR